jgi:PST family polysaccharide transporter
VSDTTLRFAAGARWLYGYRWLERLLDVVSIVVLARILSPDDFGLVAIASSFVSIIEGLSAFDVNKALIRTRDEERALYDSAWTLSALRGVVSALCMVSIAPFLSDARIGAVLYVLALSPLLSGLSNPRFVVFERELVYSRLAVLTVGSKLVSFAVTLIVAVAYRSYWALVLGLLAGTLVSTILTYVLQSYRPRVSFARVSDIVSFSGWLSLTSVVTTVSMETDRLIVGRLLGVAEAGLYYMTLRVGMLPTRELISPLQRILFPSFSELAGDRSRLRRVVGESINVLGSLSLPAGCGFALVANDFVPLGLGGQWRVIVPLLTVLAPYLALRATLSMTLPCVMALGETRLLFRVSCLYAAVHLPAFIAATALFGLTGSIGSIVAAGMLYSYLNAWMLRKTLGLAPREIVGPLRRPLLATAVMVGAVFAVDAATPLDLFSEAGSWLSLVIKMLVGAIVFGAVQYVIWRLEGRPAGIEQRLLQVLGGWPGPRGGASARR